ncbi:MAG: Mbeg1-like protein [Dokdonella sp.]
MSLSLDTGASRSAAANFEPALTPATSDSATQSLSSAAALETRSNEPSYHPQLSALQGGGTPAGGASFDAQVRGKDAKPVDLKLAELSADVYDVPGSGVEGWTRLSDAELAQANIQPGQLDDPSTGFRAALYRDDAGHVVLAFAGTDPKSGKDWLADGAQAAGLPTAQYDEAVRVATLAKKEFGGNLVLTGHSLGGGLASVASVATNSAAVTFNAAGVNNSTLSRYVHDADPATLKQQANDGLVRRYAVKGDILTGEQESGAGRGFAPDAIGHKIELAPASTLPWVAQLPGVNLISDTAMGIKLHLMGSVLGSLQQDHPWTPGGPGESLVDRIADGTGKVGDAIVGGIDSVKNGATDVIGSVTGATGDVLGHVPLIGGALEGAADGVGAIGKGAVEIAGDLADGGIGIATHVLQGAEKFVGGAIGSAVDAGRTVGGWIVDGAKAAGNAIVDGAKAAGNALVDGAKAAGHAVVDGAKAAGNAVVDGAKAVGHTLGKAMPWNW